MLQRRSMFEFRLLLSIKGRLLIGTAIEHHAALFDVIVKKLQDIIHG